MTIEQLTEIAERMRLDATGVVPVASLSVETERLKHWITAGKNAGMAYMANHTDLREHPQLLLEGAASVIVTLTNYYPSRLQPPGIPRIARYALGKDYHKVVKDRLFSLLKALGEAAGKPVNGRCFVDSAPVMENVWARRAGLGWQGKNTLLINKNLGSFCFIGVILTDLTFDSYSLSYTASYCGNCNRCVEACPTGALKAYEVDARRCISYHTIENKGEYPEALKRLAGNRIFGCDACQEVCPWNRKAKPHNISEFQPSPAIMSLTAADWQAMGPEVFKRLFKETALERTGLVRILRNLPDLEENY